MRSDLLIMALIVGVFTWAFRFVPTKLDISGLPPDGLVSRFLAATGPAAIATLVAASIWPMVSVKATEAVPLVAGVIVVLAVFGWRRSVVQATLAGAVAYGAAFAMMQIA